MPVVSPGDLNLLRTERHATLLSLSVYHPRILWTARVSGAQTDGATAITVYGASATTPFPHAQVLFGTTAGARNLGEARWKSYSAPTLYVGTHNSALPADAYVTVVEEIKPDAIHVSIVGGVVKEDADVDYAGTDANVKYPPLALMGPPAVSYIDPTTGLATVEFYSSSVAVAPGKTITNWSWDFPSGTPATSAIPGSAIAPISVTWNTPGEYYASLTVTDSNGKTHTRYTPVFIYDSTFKPYTQIEISNMQGDHDSGAWQATLTVWQDATTAEFPDRALCVVSARDWFGDQQVSIGGQYKYRENIVLIGYVKAGTTKKDANKSYVEFQIESITGTIANIWELASLLQSVSGVPAGWHELQNMTLNLAAHHLLTQHSTISQIADVHLDLRSYYKGASDLMDSSLADQLRQAACTPGRGRLCASAQGMVYLESDPQLSTLAERAAYTPVLSTDLRDFRGEVDFGSEEQQKQVSQLDLSAEDAVANPIFSLAPPSPWTSGISETVDGIRANSQSEGNDIAGLFEGERNNLFQDVVFPLRGNYRVFDIAPAECLSANILASQNKRGIAWANQRCWPKSVSYDYKPGILLATIVVEKDAVPSSGITGQYPVEPPEQTIPEIPAIPPIEPIPPIEIYPGGPEVGQFRVRQYLATNAKGIFYTSDFSPPGGAMPTWAAVNTGLPSLAVRQMYLDPFTPSTKQYCMVDQVDVYMRSGGGAWASIANKVALRALTNYPGEGLGLFNFCVDINTPGFLCLTAVGGGGGGRFYFFYTNNYGGLWHCANPAGSGIIGGGFNQSSYLMSVGLLKGSSTYAAGQVIYLWVYNAGSAANSITVSIDKGLNWVDPAITPGTWFGVMQLDIFQDVLYVWHESGPGVAARKPSRSMDRCATLPVIFPGAITFNAAVNQSANQYKLQPTHDPTQPLSDLIIRIVDGTNGVQKTIDRGVSWSAIAPGAPFNDGGAPTNLGIAVLGDASDKLYGINVSGHSGAGFHHVYASIDDGATWDPKAGADVSTTTVTGIPNDCGGVSGIFAVCD